MVLFGILCIIILGAIYMSGEFNRWLDKIGFCLMVVPVVSGIIFACVAVFSVFCGLLLPVDYEYSQKKQLVSFSDSAGVKGDFFLGSGVIESKYHYVFYEQTANGIKMGKIPVDNTRIYEHAKNTGHIKVYKIKYASDWFYIFVVIPTKQTPKYKYEAFVPKGSLAHKFRLDME